MYKETQHGCSVRYRKLAPGVCKTGNNLVYVNTMAKSDKYTLCQNCRYHSKNRRQEEIQYAFLFSSLHETNL